MRDCLSSDPLVPALVPDAWTLPACAVAGGATGELPTAGVPLLWAQPAAVRVLQRVVRRLSLVTAFAAAWCGLRRALDGAVVAP